MIIEGFGKKGCDNKDDEDEESLLFGSSMIIVLAQRERERKKEQDFEVLCLRISVFEWWFE